jgi:hypothetical protein
MATRAKMLSAPSANAEIAVRSSVTTERSCKRFVHALAAKSSAPDGRNRCPTTPTCTCGRYDVARTEAVWEARAEYARAASTADGLDRRADSEQRMTGADAAAVHAPERGALRDGGSSAGEGTCPSSSSGAGSISSAAWSIGHRGSGRASEELDATEARYDAIPKVPDSDGRRCSERLHLVRIGPALNSVLEPFVHVGSQERHL